MSQPEVPLLRGLPPVVDRRTRVLILGSFPSVASLAAGQYYAHGRNQFWRLLGNVLGRALHEMPYPDRLIEVQDLGVGIWDVYASCLRQGSLDTAIRQGKPNDFECLKEWTPALVTVCFNGAAAARFTHQVGELGYQVRVLPSSSPANASKSFAEKQSLWCKGIGFPQHDPG